MKIRNGFVSNSSSSSFVVVMDENLFCSCCSIKYEEIFSDVIITDDYLSEAIEYLEKEKNEILIDKRTHHKDEIAFSYMNNGVNQDVTYGMRWSWKETEIESCEKEIDEIKSLMKDGKRCYKMEIDYNNRLSSDILDSLLKTKSVELIGDRER